jgi:hypothetical protein
MYACMCIVCMSCGSNFVDTRTELFLENAIQGPIILTGRNTVDLVVGAHERT